MVAAPGVLRPHCEHVRAIARGARPARVRVAMGEREAGASRERRHLQRLRRSRGRRSAVGARHGAAAHLGGGMEPARSGADPADAAAQPDPGATSTARSGCSATACCRRRSCSRNPAFLRPCHGIRRAARHTPAPARRRPGALAGRSVVGAGRSDAGAVGRRLRARKPDRAVAQPARGVPRLSGAAAGVVLSRFPRTRWPRSVRGAGASRRSCC